MHQSDIESTIISILNRFNVEKVGIFGSYARQDHQPSSDFMLQDAVIRNIEIIGEASL